MRGTTDQQADRHLPVVQLFFDRNRDAVLVRRGEHRVRTRRLRPALQVFEVAGHAAERGELVRVDRDVLTSAVDDRLADVENGRDRVRRLHDHLVHDGIEPSHRRHPCRCMFGGHRDRENQYPVYTRTERRTRRLEREMPS